MTYISWTLSVTFALCTSDQRGSVKVQDPTQYQSLRSMYAYTLIVNGDYTPFAYSVHDCPGTVQSETEVAGASSDIDDHDEFTTVYSSCGDMNGLFYIKPSPDLGVLPVTCSNQYAMIDGSLDRNLQTLPQFLSSYDYGYYGMTTLFAVSVSDTLCRCLFEP